jgi:hypothetical protein
MEHQQQRPAIPTIDIEAPVGKPPSQFFADIAKNTNCLYHFLYSVPSPVITPGDRPAAGYYDIVSLHRQFDGWQ